LLNEYFVFWIKKEFAFHYFHKSGILYRFIIEYCENSGRQDLSEQFLYITNDFPKARLINYIREHVNSNINISIDQNKISLNQNGQFVTLYIYEKYIKFYCNTLHEAEYLLFPMLRAFNPHLFIAGNNIQNYGWITPVLKKNLNNNRQILYSSY